MNVGIDYWQTISANLDTFRQLCAALEDAGHRVYIVSAAGAHHKETARPEIESLGIPNSGIRVVAYRDRAQAPALKYEVCQELGIALFFDDRPDVCAYLNARGIVTCQVLRREEGGG